MTPISKLTPINFKKPKHVFYGLTQILKQITALYLSNEHKNDALKILYVNMF